MRLIVAIFVGKLIQFLTTTLKLGGGSAAPGYYALKVDPDLVSKLIFQIPKNIVITGTNGKTTTARILNHLLKSQGVKTIRNSSGSNLERGIASTLLSRFHLSGGKLNESIGIWETDEAAFNKIVFQTRPQLVVFLNCFRDQLDRYGEVDSVVKKWRDSLEKIDWNPTILVNSADLNTLGLRRVKKEFNPNLEFYQFRVKNHVLMHEKSINVRETKNTYKDDFLAEVLKNKGLKGSEIKINYPKGELTLSFHIPGIYHIYNLLAAFASFYLLNQPIKNIQEKINNFSPAFGRVEKFSLQPSRLKAKDGYIFLIKNPAGATAVFETIASEIKKEDRLLIALNDNFADGRDVSWIWDGQFEKLPIHNYQLTIICSGTRAQDLSLRLKYAGFNPKQIIVENNLEKALESAKSSLKGRLFILPTYTALLELQGLLAKMGIKKHYWRES